MESGNDNDDGFSKTERDRSWKKGKILVVDDDDELREMIKMALIANNFSVCSAQNGLEALKIIQKEDFNIILMDINMPEMGGIEAVEKIKSFNPKSFIIMMTGATDEEIRSSLDKGGYACLRKPFTIDKLMRSLDWYGLAEEQMRQEYAESEELQNETYVKKTLGKLGKLFTSWFSSSKD